MNSYLLIKRLLDLMIGFFLLVILSPVLIPIVIALRFSGEGEVWYFQKRIGYQNKNFDIWKFATMLKDSPNMLTGSLTLRDDPRVTSVGKYLRVTKINEIPQLINVLKGDMALVGPRPQMKIDFEAYPPDVRTRIYSIKPGITGIGSIVFRDEEKMITEAKGPPREFYDEIIAPFKGSLEIWYQENLSFWLDLKILTITLLVVFFPGLRIQRFFRDLPKAPEEIRSYL